MFQKEYFSLFLLFLQIYIALKAFSKSKEDKEKEPEQSRIKEEIQPENNEKRIKEHQQQLMQKIEQAIQQNYQYQNRNRICSFSQLHGADHTQHSTVHPFGYTNIEYQNRTVQHIETTHKISLTPNFKSAVNSLNNLHQESQEIRNFSLHQKQGVVDLNLDQNSQDTEMDGTSNSFAQRYNFISRKGEQDVATFDRQTQKLSKAFKNKYDISDNGFENEDAVKNNKLSEMNPQELLKKRHHVGEKNDKDNISIVDEEDEKVNYSVSKEYEAFKKQKTDRIMKYQAQKQQQTISQMNYLSVPYVNSVQKVCEITNNNNQMELRQLSQQQIQQQPSVQTQQLQSNVAQEILQPKQPAAQQLEKGTTELPQPQEQKQIPSNRSPSFDINQKTHFTLANSSQRKASHNENLISDKKQQKQPEQQVQQQLSASHSTTTNSSSKQVIIGNLKPSSTTATTITQPSVTPPINETNQPKQGLFGNLKASTITKAADPQSAVFAPVNKNNKNDVIPPFDLTSSVNTNPLAEMQKQQQEKEVSQTKLKSTEQQQQLFYQSPSLKKRDSVQTPLFQSQKDVAVPNFPLDNNVKNEEKISQTSLFNNNCMNVQNHNNPKPLVDINKRTDLLESPQIISPNLENKEQATSKIQGTSLFSGGASDKPSVSLFASVQGNKSDKEPSKDSALSEKPKGLFEQQKQPEISQKPIDIKINTLPPKNNVFPEIQTVQENPLNVPSAQANDASKTDETKSSAPLTGGLFSQVIKKEGDTSKVGLFQNIAKPNGLFSGEVQQQSISSQSLLQPNTPQPPQPEATKENNKAESQKQTQSTSLFGNLPIIQGPSSLSSNSEQPKSSLFGSGNQTNGLFGSIQANNLSQSIQSGGLFGQNTTSKVDLTNKSVDPSQTNLGTVPTQTQPTILPSTGLFSQIQQNTTNSTQGSLFSIPPSTQNSSLFPSGSLFGADPNKKPSGGLFGNLTSSTNSSLFSQTSSQKN